MSALSNLLDKLGLKYENLTEEEKKTYTEWSQTLSQPDVSIDDLKKFIPLQLEILEREQSSYENTEKKDLYLKAAIRNLKMIHAFILGPEQRRKWLEQHLEKRLQ